MNWDRIIADACRAWLKADQEHQLQRNKESAESVQEALRRLCWMVNAEKFGWDPANYGPEDYLAAPRRAAPHSGEDDV